MHSRRCLRRKVSNDVVIVTETKDGDHG
jgi:hypothetical protein